MSNLLIKMPLIEHNECLAQLEQMTDKIGIANVLGIIAEICSLKADHIDDNWQDNELASRWNDLCARLLTVRDCAAQHPM